MAIKLATGLCNECNDGIVKSIIGKREKALCVSHYNQALRAKSKPIAKKSETRIDEENIYLATRKVFMHDNKFCVANWDGCTRRATELHHTKGRDNYYLNILTWIPLCESCHFKIGINDIPAKEQSLSQDRITKNVIQLPFNLKVENAIDKLYSLISV